MASAEALLAQLLQNGVSTVTPDYEYAVTTHTTIAAYETELALRAAAGWEPIGQNRLTITTTETLILTWRRIVPSA